MIKIIKLVLSFSLVLTCFQNLLALDIIYDTRAPYVQEKNSSIDGLVASPLIKSLKEAGINYELKNRPSKRHLLEIKANRKEVCAVGWFKNSEREKFGKYTKALYQDKPMGIITLKDSKIEENLSLEDLFTNKDISILIKDSFSYGKDIDKKLSTTKQKIHKVNTDNSKMVLHLIRKRADFMFSSYEEALELFKNEMFKSKLEFKNIKDIPQGNKRYLICSQKVSNNTIENINKHIK